MSAQGSSEKLPRKGTLERAVFDAMHARWCGLDCPPTCTEWHPDLIEQRVAIATVKNWQPS